MYIIFMQLRDANQRQINGQDVEFLHSFNEHEERASTRAGIIFFLFSSA